MSTGLGTLLICGVCIALGGAAGVFIGLVVLLIRKTAGLNAGRTPAPWTDDDEIAARYHH